MCGITGYIHKGGQLSASVIQEMTTIMHHRGPDSFGVELFSNQELQIAFGHKRLSILDVSADGHQPMQFGENWIVYNGEVYNFQQIKTELKKLGHSFVSNSDTEVILHAFEQWGVKAVDKFIGMFAFAIYQPSLQKILLFRDRLGVKPLHYYYNGNDFIFGSELKSFHKHPNFEKEIDQSSLAQFFKYSYIQAPNSIFKHVKKLLPGHYLEFDLNQFSYQEIQYWNPIEFYEKPKFDISYSEAKEKLKALLEDAFMLRMVSDVPVGVFLSGGYDSSTVAAVIQDRLDTTLKTFTIGFEEKRYDESPYAEQVAKHINTEHYTYLCTDKEAMEIIPQLPFYYDEPFGDYSSIPSIYLSRQTKEHVTVSLSADGGDEIFFGYNSHAKTHRYYNRLKKLGIFSLGLNAFTKLFKTNEYKQNLYAQNLYQGNVMEELFHLNSYRYKNQFVQKLFLENVDFYKTNFESAKYNKIDSFHKILAIDLTTYLPDDILVKVDRATMSASLEGREPLLDHRIVEFAAQLPLEYLYKEGSKKYILKDICHDYLPKEMMDRKKTGFTPPLVNWLRLDLKEMVYSTLSEEALNQHKLFNHKFVHQIVEDFYKGNNNVFEMVWLLFSFQLWYNQWMKEEKSS